MMKAKLLQTTIITALSIISSGAYAQNQTSDASAVPGRPGAADATTEAPAVPAAAPLAPTSATNPQVAPDAPQASGGLQDIIVTANRRSEAAQRTPVAITAIGGAQLAARGVVETADLALTVPNLQIISPYGKAQPNISLRGISVANEYNANQASPIGVYIDDAYMSSRTSHGLQLYDLERVEVLRGPQGTLYGRNTTGGAVNFITVRPKLDKNSGYFEAGYGNENHREAAGAVNLVLVPDTLAIRGAVTYTKSDGFVKNVFPGVRDAQSENNFGARLSLLWKPDDKLTVFLKGYYGRDQPRAGGVNGIGATADGTNPVSGYNRGNLDTYEINTNYVGLYKFDTKGALLNVGYQINDAISVTSLTSYDTGGRNIDHNADQSPINVLRIRNQDRFKQVNQEVRLNYDKGDLKFIIGGYYGWDRVNVHNTNNFLAFLQPAIPFNFPNSPFGTESFYSQTRRSKAIFGQADYKITDKFSVTVGGRYTWDSLQYFNGYSYVFNYSGTPVINLLPAPGPYDPTVAKLKTGRDFSAFSGRFGLNYQLNNNVLAYASFSRGYRAGAVNGSGFIDPSQVTLVKPEKINAYEAGIKSDLLNRHLRLNLAGFYYDYRNQQLQEVIGPISYLRNAPKARIYGLELESTAVLTERLTVNATVGALSTRYKELTLSQQDLSGNRIPFAPNLTASGGIDFTAFEFQNGGKITASANAAYTSQQFFSPFNNGPSFTGDTFGNIRQQQKAYTLVNGRIGYNSDKLYGSLWVKNAFNKGYYVFGLDVRGSFGYDYLAVGAPRSYGATIGFRF